MTFRWILPLTLIVLAVPATAQKASKAPTDSSGVFELHEVQRLPRMENTAEFLALLDATYPAERRAAGRGAVLQLRMRIGPDGLPRDITVLESSDSAFDAPTVAAVRTLRFRPAEVDDRPVHVWVVLPVHWSVDTTRS